MSEDAALIASAVGDEAFTENELRAVIDDLKMDTGRAARLLNELGSFPDVDVRLWVPGAAREVLGEACLPLLIRMTKDPEIDVQDAAIEELVKLGPNAATRSFPTYAEN